MASNLLHLQVNPRNISQDSSNAIHGDDAAKTFGFEGALVPGAELFGYLARVAISRWGVAWLNHGRLRAQFKKPVYEGRAAIVEGIPEADALDLQLRCDGVACVVGWAGLPPPGPSPSLDFFKLSAQPDVLPIASEHSLAPGKMLCVPSFPISLTDVAVYLRDTEESVSLFADEGIVPPGMLLRLCNRAVYENVKLGPWVHTGSEVINLAPARAGRVFSARAFILSNYEHNGHKFIHMDVVIVAGDEPVARVMHTAIYELRSNS